MHEYTHWLKIHTLVPTRNEARQYEEIQNYLDSYSDAEATIYLYANSRYDRVVKLECSQDGDELDLNANSGFHALARLPVEPTNICSPQAFAIPKRLQHILHHSTPAREAR